MPNGIWSLELPSLALDPAGHQDVLGNFAGDRHASFRPQTPEDVQKIVREASAPLYASTFCSTAQIFCIFQRFS